MEIDVSILKAGKSYATEEIHFTGGLRGAPTNLGWALFPTSDDPHSDALIFDTPKAHLDFAIRECRIRFIGTCVKYRSDTKSPPMDVWEFGARDPANGLGAADSWGTIAHQAALAGDTQYAETASYVSASLTVAGLRLRDVSNGYHDQLSWALAEKRPPGDWFSNAALQDLYADFHSLTSELSSARDYLAKIAAIHIGAPDRIDGIARLEDWLGKPENHTHTMHPIAHTLLATLGPKAAPGWLRRMGAIRNEMLHRVPMGANRTVAGLMLDQTRTALGPISTIRLAEPLSKIPLSQQSHDPLIELSQLSASLEALCRAVWKHAKYPAEPLRFTSPR